MSFVGDTGKQRNKERAHCELAIVIRGRKSVQESPRVTVPNEVIGKHFRLILEGDALLRV